MEINIRSVNEFEMRWQNKCEEFKKCSFDEDTYNCVLAGFRSELAWYATFSAEMTSYEIRKITNDVVIALRIAHSNYKKQKKGIWSSIKEIVFVKISH